VSIYCPELTTNIQGSFCGYLAMTPDNIEQKVTVQLGFLIC
jgi:hypothetical protein